MLKYYRHFHKKENSTRRKTVFQIFIDGLRLFRFPKKPVHAHISCRQNKNKLKEKYVESSEQLVNRVPTSLYTSFVSCIFEKNCQTVAQYAYLDVQIEGQLLLYNFMVYPQRNDILSKK